LSLVSLVVWGLWLRIAAADLVQWYVQRKGLPVCLFPDAAYYWLLADKIRRGEPFELLYFGDLPHFALRTPGYPLFLAACQSAFGPRVLPVRLVQAVLGAACVWLVARLSRRALPDMPRSVPLIAAALTALDPFVMANSAFVLSEALFLPLMLVGQCAFAAMWDQPRTRFGWAVLAGAATAAAVLTRPSWSLYFAGYLVLWLILQRGDRRAALRSALILVVAACVVMAPWWVRNARIYGRFVPTALWMGASLYDGLNPRANGDSEMSFLADPDIWPLDEEAQDAALRDKAIAFARANPGRVVTLAAIKAARFWSPWPNAEGFRSWPLMLAGAIVSLPQFIFLALGVWDRRRDARALVLLGLPLAYTFAMHLVFVSSMRYRIPVAVPATGLAAVGFVRVIGGRWSQSGRSPVAGGR
jgi:4-amino-4-deoxy-L-arabinose transferase-like glycosyltransferase